MKKKVYWIVLLLMLMGIQANAGVDGNTVTPPEGTEKWLYARTDWYGEHIVFYGDWEPQWNDDISGMIRFKDVYDNDTIIYPTWWDGVRGTVKKVVFEESCKDIIPIKNTAHMFERFLSLEAIEGMENLNTSAVTNMSGMFKSCHLLKDFDFNVIDTRSVTDMSEMFQEYGYLPYPLSQSDLADNIVLDLSSWKTNKVRDFSRMFYSCMARAIDIGSFNTAHATTMNSMFSGCRNLVSLDVSHFNTSNVTDMSSMFRDVKAKVDVSHFDTSNVRDMSSMFADSPMTMIDVSHFSTTQVTDMRWMFVSCKSLERVNLFSLPEIVAEPIKAYAMFDGCIKLRHICVEKDWDVSSIDAIGPSWIAGQVYDSMFSDCVNLKGGAGTKYENSHIDASYAHIDGGEDNPGYFSTEEQIITGISLQAASRELGYLFDLQGRRLSGVPQRGMYIQNGRKYVVK